MNNRGMSSAVVGLTAALLLAGCGGPVMSGIAVGKAGHSLAAHTQATPQGASVCAMQEALAAQGPGADKPSEACARALRSDRLWRRAFVVLGAYGQTLEVLASGGSTDEAGQLEAALTGVRGPDWMEVDAPEQPARDAVAQLAVQLAAPKSDLTKTVKDAAPHVQTLCEGLSVYLETQAKGLGDLQREAERKRAARADRRCGSFEGKSVCVSESSFDRMVLAGMLGQTAMLESAHADARDAVAGFCAAHRELEKAAGEGNLSKDKTYVEVVEAVKKAPRSQAPAPVKPKK